VIGGVGAVAAVAWWELLRDGDVACAASMGTPWSGAALWAAIVMWTVMMVAMMLPSAAPMIVTYARIQRHRSRDGQAATLVALFAGGYLIAWTAWSVLAALLQWTFQSLLVMSGEMALHSALLAAAFLVTAGIYQLTALKRMCLVHCQSPIGFFMTRWREGGAGALAMGARHGGYCVGCCWALMGLLFVVGVMNLVWVAALTAYVLLEKIVPERLVPWLGASRLVGVGLIGWGAWMALP